MPVSVSRLSLAPYKYVDLKRTITAKNEIPLNSGLVRKFRNNIAIHSIANDYNLPVPALNIKIYNSNKARSIDPQVKFSTNIKPLMR